MVDALKNMRADLGEFDDDPADVEMFEDRAFEDDLRHHRVNERVGGGERLYAQARLRPNRAVPPTLAMPASEWSPVGHLEQTQCIVKWFNPVKGYGFVMPLNVHEDIFMHFSILDAAGYQYLGPGDEINCMVLQGDKGRQVTEIVEVKPARQSPSPYLFGYRQQQPSGPLEDASGEVKWFNTIRGFGFVKADNGGRDIFVHASVLRRIGLQKIYPGQRVQMQVSNSESGRQAWSLELLEDV